MGTPFGRAGMLVPLLEEARSLGEALKLGKSWQTQHLWLPFEKAMFRGQIPYCTARAQIPTVCCIKRIFPKVLRRKRPLVLCFER